MGYSLPPGGELFLVQLRTVSLPAWRKAIEEAGGKVLAFFPHNAHIVRMPPSLVDHVASLDFVRRVEPYETWYRLEPALRDWLLTQGDEQIRVRVVALERGPAGKGRILDTALPVGARDAEYGDDGHVLELWVDREQLRAVAGHDDVMWIDRWTPPETDMDVVRQDSGADWLEVQDTSCGQGVRGEVMDNGIQADHQDFDGVIFHGVDDERTHGTQVYGIVFGNGDRDGDGDGLATGHLPCNEQGIFADYDLLGNRFTHTQELKAPPYLASFQTNSWGHAPTIHYTSISQEMDDIIWQLDIAIVQSQSNEGSQSSRPQAWAKNIISVGGIKHQNTLSPGDDDWCVTDPSDCASIGPAHDGRIKPDVHYWYDGIYATARDNGYDDFGGTSAATPEVAGVLGLMLQMWADNTWNTDPVGSTVYDKQPHFGTLKALLINNARQYPFTGTGDDLTRVHQGWGRPSVEIASQRAATSFIVDQDQPLEVGESATYLLNVPAGESELKVTMVYPDPPGTTGTTLHRINDLDLRVVSPSAVTYHGNVGLDVGTTSTPGGSPNDVDTVENVFIADPEAGTWIVEVSAPEINQDAHLATVEDDAVFALVVTGATADGVSTPGEAGTGGSKLVITDYDPVTEVMQLSYGRACASIDHAIEYGSLTYSDLAGYNWSGQQCGVGIDGTYTWDASGAPPSVFFVIVGHGVGVEGSYGTDWVGAERPDDPSGAICPAPQDLSDPCS